MPCALCSTPIQSNSARVWSMLNMSHGLHNSLPPPARILKTACLRIGLGAVLRVLLGALYVSLNGPGGGGGEVNTGCQELQDVGNVQNLSSTSHSNPSDLRRRSHCIP